MLIYASLFFSIVTTVLLFVILFRKKDDTAILIEKNERNLREEFFRSREENAESLKRIREEVSKSIALLNDSLLNRMNEFSSFQTERFDNFNSLLKDLIKSNNENLEKINSTVQKSLAELSDRMNKISGENREELGKAINLFEKKFTDSINSLISSQEKKFKDFNDYLKELTDKTEKKLEYMRETVENNLKRIQEDNNSKLEKMRETVEEKLQSTLNERIGESFKIVSDRLEAVQKGLGEMKNLATGVGDLKKVLTNVKARGTWGEVQLHAILEQILTPEQYALNVQTDENSSERVEFAVKLPGKDDSASVVWLPIDSKFPQEDYLRLLDAVEAGDSGLIQKYSNELVRAVTKSAEEINRKYINPPFTTDFALMFLPTEGLYAEVLRVPGLIEKIQQTNRVVIVGPTTMSAILNSLKVGFRTLAIEKRSSEVWKVLSAVKTEFKKFGDILDKVKKQLNTAANTIEQTGVRTRAMERKLKDVEEIPETEAVELLDLK
jgi:DNA recombination protein RmuC